jgi:tRNA dimethylallyltransferase
MNFDYFITDDSNDVIVITGPTASGKTGLAISLAKEMNGEIVSADSMQIYKYMDIGTAKPSSEERLKVKHHMIDIIEPDKTYSVAQYKKDAEKCIEEIIEKGKHPIVVGGTGLYINALAYNINFPDIQADESLRDELTQLAHIHGNDYVFNILEETDPQAANRLHPNNLKRVIRAIEIKRITGESIIDHEARSREIPPKYNYKIFMIDTDREILYQRINDRVDQMINDGLVNEVAQLIENGFIGTNAMQAIGYKELAKYFSGAIALDEAIDLIKQESRRYAKRQITWIKKIEDIKLVDITKI